MFPPNYPFPFFALPPILREAVAEVQATVQAPIELAFASAIGALSLACQHRFDVRRPNGIESPCSLFVITVADSGERKTSCDKLFMQPIREFDTASEQAAEEEWTQYQADFQIWSIHAKALRSELRNLAAREVRNDQ